MEYVYACMLLHEAKKEINEANIKKVVEAAGVKADDARVKALVAALEGVDIKKAIEEAAHVPVAAVSAAPSAAVHKKEEKKEEKSAETATAGLAGLFG